MHLTPEGKFVRSDIWREGEWIDLWSAVHFLSGMVIGFFPYYLGLSAVAAFPITFLLLVMYEMWEALVKIEETRANRVMDVVVGMASFTPVFFMHPHLTLAQSLTGWGMAAAAATVLSFFGWRASQKAYVLEQKMRKEFEAQKEKFMERRDRFARRLYTRPRLRRRKKRGGYGRQTS